MNTPKALIEFVRSHFNSKDFIPLHRPVFSSTEEDLVLQTVKSTFVSSVGEFVDKFERKLEIYTGTRKAVATVNGTSALYTSLYVAGVQLNDLVITQAVTFVATCNAIKQLGAEPVFVDVSKETMGMCPDSLEEFLIENSYLDQYGNCRLKKTHQIIRAVLPMHTFGHPINLDRIVKTCIDWNIVLIEDAAESLGSLYKGKHTGTFGKLGTFSFNGNKIITTGGGGAILCQSLELGNRVKHITTTAKVPHAYEYNHDELGFNFRLPNLNAALGCAQMESLEAFIENKRELASNYQKFFNSTEYQFFSEPPGCRSNYWLNAVICPDEKAKRELLEVTNQAQVMTRPLWTLMTQLSMYKDSISGPLHVSHYFSERVVNLPSSVNF